MRKPVAVALAIVAAPVIYFAASVRPAVAPQEPAPPAPAVAPVRPTAPAPAPAKSPTEEDRANSLILPDDVELAPVSDVIPPPQQPH